MIDRVGRPRLVVPLLCTLVACVLGAATARAAGVVPAYAPGRVIVRVSESARAAWAPAGQTVPAPPPGLEPFGVRRVESLFRARRHSGPSASTLQRYFRLWLAPGADPVAAAASLRGVAGIESAAPVPVVRTSVVPNDPSFPVQWHLQRGDGHDARVPGAWDRTQGDSAVVLAIADTGVDWMHPDLAAQIALNAAEANGLPGVDDDGNGYTDDIRGWDFVTADSASVGVGEDPGPPDNDPRDWAGHGTEVAGAAGAATDDGVGIAGVAWHCKVLPVRIGFGVTGVDGGVIYIDDAAAGIVYAADRGAAVLNASWDSTPDDAFTAAVDYALSTGMVIVDAAGNHKNESITSNGLALRGDCIDVAATDTTDVLANFSSYGNWVDLCAPGTRILTTAYNPLFDDHTYDTPSGTSLSAPVVSGVVALLRARFPSWPASRLRERLLATCDPLDGLNASIYGGKLGRGRVNAAAACGSETTFWQAPLSGQPRSALALADFGVGRRGIAVLASDDGAVTALRPGGVALPGWPVQVGASPGLVACGTLGGAPVVIAGGADGLLHAWAPNGSERPGWPANLAAALRGGASLGTAGSPATEVVACGTEGKRVYLLDAGGAVLSGWPQSTRGAVRASPALADLDGDGANEIVVAAADSQAYAWRLDGTAVAGWPVRLPGACLAPVAVGDIATGGAQRVVVACTNGSLTLLGQDGATQAGWPVTLGSTTAAPPALADLDGDGQRDIVCASGTTLAALRANGTPLPGWPLTASGSVAAAPLVADLDGDGLPDVLAVTTTNALQAFDRLGAALAGFPRYAGGALRGAPVVGDCGGDGDANLVSAAADSFVEALTLPGAVRTPLTAPWAMASHDAARTGWTGTATSTAVRGGHDEDAVPGAPFHLALAGAQRGVLTLRLSAPRATRVTLDVFDVRGRRLAQHTCDATPQPRIVRLEPHAADGIVLIRASVDGHTSSVLRALVLR